MPARPAAPRWPPVFPAPPQDQLSSAGHACGGLPWGPTGRHGRKQPETATVPSRATRASVTPRWDVGTFLTRTAVRGHTPRPLVRSERQHHYDARRLVPVRDGLPGPPEGGRGGGRQAKGEKGPRAREGAVHTVKQTRGVRPAPRR